MEALRIKDHPIMNIEQGRKIKFTFQGRQLEGYEGEPIAAALLANGVKVLSRSNKLGRSRGFYCAIGNCSSCLMEVNGISNVRTCVESLREGMVVRIQEGRGVISAQKD